jgi:hypothetical protein
MKFVKKSQHEPSKLPAFWISSENFFQIIKKTAAKTDGITVEVDISGDEKIILESLDEIQDNKHLLTKKFIIMLGSIRLSLNHFSRSIFYDPKDEAVARALLEDLKYHQPFIFKFLNKNLFIASIALPVVTYLVLKPDATSDQMKALVILLFFVALPVSLFISKVIVVPRILHVNERSFWSRNKDKIIWSSATFLLALFGTHWRSILENLQKLVN